MFPAGNLAISGATLAVSTIWICYFISGYQGHTPWWMPDITHCGRGGISIFNVTLDMMAFPFFDALESIFVSTLP
jgi:hypothetical protein